MIGVMIVTEVGIGQAVAEIVAQVTVGQDQDLDPVPIGTE